MFDIEEIMRLAREPFSVLARENPLLNIEQLEERYVALLESVARQHYASKSRCQPPVSGTRLEIWISGRAAQRLVESGPGGYEVQKKFKPRKNVISGYGPMLLEFLTRPENVGVEFDSKVLGKTAGVNEYPSNIHLSVYSALYPYAGQVRSLQFGNSGHKIRLYADEVVRHQLEI